MKKIALIALALLMAFTIIPQISTESQGNVQAFGAPGLGMAYYRYYQWLQMQQQPMLVCDAGTGTGYC